MTGEVRRPRPRQRELPIVAAVRALERLRLRRAVLRKKLADLDEGIRLARAEVMAYTVELRAPFPEAAPPDADVSEP